jgi:hypothetical protein
LMRPVKERSSLEAGIEVRGGKKSLLEVELVFSDNLPTYN